MLPVRITEDNDVLPYYPAYSGGTITLITRHRRDFYEPNQSELTLALEQSPILYKFHTASDQILEVIKKNKDYDDQLTLMSGELIDLFRCLNLRDISRLTLLNFMSPEFNEEGTTVSYYPDGVALSKGRKVTTKLGKFIRALTPDSLMSDAWVENRVNILKSQYFPRTFTVKVGSSREDFKHAYTHTQSVYRDPCTTDFRKSLANSCMRYAFDDGPHPAEYYASGDFSIVWAEDDGGCIAARTVVGNGYYGPIYGVCEQSLDEVAKYLEENGFHPDYHERGWLGLSLLVLPWGADSCRAAYLDFYEYVRKDGDVFIITDDRAGSISAKYHEGYFHLGSLCSSCEVAVHPDDAYTGPDGEDFCEECYLDIYGRCSVTDEVIPLENLVEARSIHWRWSDLVNSELVIMAEDGEMWLEEDTVTLPDGRVYPEDSDDIFLSGFSGSYHHVSDLCETEDGDEGTEEELISAGYTYSNEQGEWVRLTEGEEECQIDAA